MLFHSDKLMFENWLELHIFLLDSLGFIGGEEGGEDVVIGDVSDEGEGEWVIVDDILEEGAVGH